MNRYWINWLDLSYQPDICADFQYWITGYSWGGTNIRAVVDAETEEQAWSRVQAVFTRMKRISIEEKDLSWKPEHRYTDFENRT